jgi:hypothetical protein
LISTVAPIFTGATLFLPYENFREEKAVAEARVERRADLF